MSSPRASEKTSARPQELTAGSEDGVPAEKMASLFTPFLQLDDSEQNNVGGTGLGLAISRELARAMGGELRVDGETRAGATFILSLTATGLSPVITAKM